VLVPSHSDSIQRRFLVLARSLSSSVSLTLAPPRPAYTIAIDLWRKLNSLYLLMHHARYVALASEMALDMGVREDDRRERHRNPITRVYCPTGIFCVYPGLCRWCQRLTRQAFTASRAVGNVLSECLTVFVIVKELPGVLIPYRLPIELSALYELARVTAESIAEEQAQRLPECALRYKTAPRPLRGRRAWRLCLRERKRP